MFTPEQQRSIFLEYAVSPRFFKVADICEKYELSKYRLSKIRKSLSGVIRTMHELVLAALYLGADNMASLASTCDYLNHAIPTETELKSSLAALQESGLCKKTDGRWQPAKSRTDLFLFIAP